MFKLPLVSRRPALRHVCAAFTLTALGSNAFAANYTVTNCFDAGAGSLRQAVFDANATPGEDTINFNLSCATITLSSGTIVISESLTINAPGATSLTLSNPSGTALRLEPAALAPASQQVQINGLRIANSGTTDTPRGGAIDAIRTNLGISNSVFAANFAASGSAIAFLGSGAATPTTLNVVSTTFVGNARNDRAAGAIVVTDAVSTIDRSYFKENGAGAAGSGANASFPGGAIFAQRGALLVVDSVFQGNRGTYGGAIARTGTPSDTARILRSTFFGNVAYGTSDVGANLGGGAIFAQQVPITIENATFTNNAVQGAGYGAAIDTRGVQLTLRNATIAANSVESSLTANAALTVFIDPDATATPTVLDLANSVATDTRAATTNARFDAWIGNPLGGATYTSIVDASLVSRFRNQVGDSVNPAVVSLGALAFNGGLAAGAADVSQQMLTMMPLPGSPLINAGDNAFTTNLSGVDQRGSGFARIVDATVDIGAVEFVAAAAVADVPVPSMPMTALYLLASLVATFAGFSLRRKQDHHQ
jgi:hypothetical protein